MPLPQIIQTVHNLKALIGHLNSCKPNNTLEVEKTASEQSTYRKSLCGVRYWHLQLNADASAGGYCQVNIVSPSCYGNNKHGTIFRQLSNQKLIIKRLFTNQQI